MGIKSILGDIFGAGGLATSVVDVLKGTGVIKDAEAELKAKQALMEFELKLADNEARVIESINATMREEAKSENWAQWLWRPIVGFTFSAVVINNYLLMPWFQKYIHPIVVPTEVWMAMLTILGVAAGFRGWKQVVEARNGNNK